MKLAIIPLVIILILLLGIVILFLIIKSVVSNFLETYFGTRSLKEAIEKSEIESENTPKSLASMENLLKPTILKDFPDLNINELKSMTQNAILDYYNAIENKDIDILKNYNDTIKNLAISKIDDYKDKTISYEDIKFHKTVLNRYEKNKSIATITTETGLEYYYKEDNKIKKKIQNRYKVELIYVIDANLVPKDKKLLGLNCPNCGAPITTLGEKKCTYCNTGIKDIIKRTWVINNIKEF